MPLRLTALLFLFVMVPYSASAADKLRGEVFCFPAKGIPQMVERLQNMTAKRTDIVDVDIMPKFLIKDGGDWPERFFLRGEDNDVDIPIEKPSGATPIFLQAVKANPKTDICVVDKARAKRAENDEGLYFEMGLSPFFHNRSGRYDMAELEEGTKDGKHFYKKMMPAAMRMLMPNTDHLAVKYNDEKSLPDIQAQVGGKLISLKSEAYRDMHVIAFKALKEMDATALVIKGGAYNLQPTVSVKTMKRFGWGQEEDENEN